MCKALKIQEIDKNIITHEIDKTKNDALFN